MTCFSFSLKWLLAAVAIAALGCTALIYASPFWERAVISLMCCLLLMAMLASIFRRGKSQAFAVGFVICGIAYLWMAFRLENQSGTSTYLVTTQLLRRVHYTIQHQVPEPLAPRPSPSQMGGMGMAFGTGGPRVIPMKTVPNKDWFMHIGQWMWSIVIATLGGVLARKLYCQEHGPAP